MADLVDAMLRRLLQAVTGNDTEAIREIADTGKALGRGQKALKSYLTQLGTDGLSDIDARRHGHVLDFTINLGHSGDIIAHSLADAATSKAKRGLALSAEDEADLRAFHGRVRDDLALAASTFMTEDIRSAQRLLDAKRQVNAMERATGRRHLAGLEVGEFGGLEASRLYLAILRDLRRVNSHLAAIAYDVLGMDSDNVAESHEEAPGPEDADPVADHNATS
jgi:phosphate:Na+ symporter